MFRFWTLAAVSLSLTYILLSIEPAVAQEKPLITDSPPAHTGNTERVVSNDQPAATAPEKATREQLEQWITELIHPKFAIRQAASQKLLEAGRAGMEAVAKAADSPDLELATRCLAILNEGLSSSDDSSKKAAREALNKLTKSQNKSVAQRAQQALEISANPPRAILPQGFRNGRLPPMGVNNVAIQVNVNNGRRETKITENGKEIVIKDNNRQDIQVSITDTVNGMKKTTVAEGKDPDDLKKNSPEAHAYFEKYKQGDGNIFRVQVGLNAPGGNGPGGDFKFPERVNVRRLPRLISPVKASGLFEEIEKLRLKIDAANERLAKFAEADHPDVAELKKISQEITVATKRLAEIKNESTIP
jgi:hypothetical protein